MTTAKRAVMIAAVALAGALSAAQLRVRPVDLEDGAVALGLVLRQLATTAVLTDALGPDVQVDASAGSDSVEIRVGPLVAGAADPGRRRVLDALADAVELEPGDDGATTWAVLTFARGGAR